MYQPNQTFSNMYNVIQTVGWLKGSNGTGNVFLLRGPNGELGLAMKWLQDEGNSKFHSLSKSDFIAHLETGKAGVLKQFNTNAEFDGFLEVENADNYERIFTPVAPSPSPTTPTPTPEPDGGDDDNDDYNDDDDDDVNVFGSMDIEIPYQISGTINIKVGDLFESILKMALAQINQQ